jgi:predicted DNA-binding protein (UPF0251 family)
MPRPLKPRWIQASSAPLQYAPLARNRGGHPADPPLVVLTLDELEALRLGDLEGMTQEQGAAQMRVSRATFGRIVASAHRKVADALCTGKRIHIVGGAVRHVSPGAGAGPRGPHGRGRGGHRHGRGHGGGPPWAHDGMRR